MSHPSGMPHRSLSLIGHDPAAHTDVAPLVRVLGSSQIDTGSVTMAQRTVVAALVLHRPHGATVETLADAIWPTGAPATARASVQNQIGRLRRSFGADFIEHRHDRYVLTVDSDIDVLERAVSDDLTSIDVLASALALWRGTPFDDLADDPRAEVERVRLNRLRDIAVERLAAARISAGRAEESILDLSVHVASEQFHERAWELLVAALYLAGRRSEALVTYVRFERILGDEIGACPSATFRALQRSVAHEESIAHHLPTVGASMPRDVCSVESRTA
ncbi:MAG: BTAD domain-containing putative transcriptional regulator [Ilumatobacteraceae bacterium]